MRYWLGPNWGAVAQLGERRPCKAEVVGSNPISSTKVLDARYRTVEFEIVDPVQNVDLS